MFTKIHFTPKTKAEVSSAAKMTFLLTVIILLLCRPGPGDVVDAALKKCNVAEGKFILSFQMT